MSSSLTGGVVFGSRTISAERSFAPSVVFDADHRAFPHSGAMHDDVLELERGDPFASGLDDVLDAIGDPQIAVGRNHSDIIGVQITAGPQLLGGVGTVEVAVGQPGRPHDDFA